MKKDKRLRLYVQRINSLKLWFCTRFKLFQKLFQTTYSEHLIDLQETKSYLIKLIDNKNHTNEIKRSKYFTKSFFQSIFIDSFEIKKHQVDEKSKCLNKFLFHKKAFSFGDLQNITTDPIYDKSIDSMIERFALYKNIIDLENLSESAYLKSLKSCELLSKRVVNRELSKNSVIPLLNEEAKLSFYYVYETIFSKKGLVGYALRSLKYEPPILVFRGTQINIFNRESLHSLFDNLSKKIASKGYKASKNKIDKLLNDPIFLNKKAIIIGMSLGGAYAQRVVLNHHDKIQHLITFHSIGLDKESLDFFAFNTYENLKITIIRKQNDIAHLLGDGHLTSHDKK